MPLPARLTLPVAHRPSFEIAVPGSKSITNRAMVLAALAQGRSRLSGTLVAEDTLVMRQALTALGFDIQGEGERLEVTGQGGRVPSNGARLDLRLSGTSIRFLTALVALGEGSFELDGNQRMRERPLGHLLAALSSLGARAYSLAGNDCPPVRVEASGLAGGEVSVAGQLSSQFLSALLMVSPYARQPTGVSVSGELQSQPFVDMTLELMQRFGVAVGRDGYHRFDVPTGHYQPQDIRIEGDAMAAGYFWAAAAVTGGRARVTNVGSDSVQGDRRLADVLATMGCRVDWGSGWSEVRGPAPGELRGGTFDLNDMPDQAQTLAVVALFADSPVEILNVGNLRIKETDRLSALASELSKFGAEVDERSDSLLVRPAERLRPAVVETYGDHRMAMAFAVAALMVPGTEILDPSCVEKTYPAFFDDLRESLAAETGL